LTDEKEVAEFYVMSARTLNTFSKEEALKIQDYGSYKIESVINVPIYPVNTIIEENFPRKAPNFISLDVEGLDYEIVKSLNLDKFRPEVLCIETLTYTEDNSERKLNEIIDYLTSQNYFVYADTYINTIFVEESVWNKR
jgi:hypothetical protein